MLKATKSAAADFACHACREERTRTFNLVLQRHLLCRLSYFPNPVEYCSKTRANLKRETDASERQSLTFTKLICKSPLLRYILLRIRHGGR